MIIVDAHCDTITRIMDCKKSLYRNDCHIDLERMLGKNKHVQIFAAFIDPAYCQAYAMKRALQVFDKLYEQVELYSDSISLCRCYDDIMSALDNGRVAAILSLEGGEALQGEISALRMYYRLGVRSICLTWNYRNEIADGVRDSASGGGLTPFGREVIKQMNSLGMLVDLSHIAEKGFWDVMEITDAPVIVSHSNAKAVCNNARNLTDEQIKEVKRVGGVIGINLYPYFLNNTEKASIKDVIYHIEHICGLIGCDNIGIGADFDGIECTPADIKGIEDIEVIFNELLKLNYSQDNVEKIAGKNFLRVIKCVIK
jgi:membrane dipeptidase